MVPNLTRIQSTSFLKLSLPLILEVTFVIVVSNLVVWMLSAYNDQVAAGVSIAGQINNTIFLFFSIVSMGSGILMAQSVGAKSPQKRQEIFSTALFFAILFAIVGTVIYLIFYRQIFSFYQLENSVQAFAEQYGLILAPLFIFNAIFLVFNQTLYANGKTLEAFIALVFCDSSILIFSAMLIFGVPFLGIPSFGVVGAAIAIGIGRVVYFIGLGFFIRKELKLNFRFPKQNPFQAKVTKLLFKVGSPAVFENISYTFFMILITRIIAGFGTDALVAKAYFDSLAMFTYFIMAAMANASAIKVGQLVGGGAFIEAESTVKYALRFSFVATIVPSLTLALTIGTIAALFTNNPTVITMMVALAIIDVFLEIGRLLNVVVNRAIKASGDARYPLISIIVIQWVLILPLALLLGIWLNLGLIGVWIALAVDELIRGINLYFRWQSKRWQLKSQKLNQHMHVSE
ncbi:MAG: MATE family efflux transporter [Bacilli bacterium]